MMKVYIAAPLFNEMERERNLRIDDLVQSLGYVTYLPQRDGGELAKMVQEAKTEEEILKIRKHVFDLDILEVETSDILLFLLDGRVPDEGACFELGIAYYLGKKCIGYKTDIRNFADGQDNLMIHQALSPIVHSLDELRHILEEIGHGYSH